MSIIINRKKYTKHPEFKQMPKFIIGVDPESNNKSGFAVFDCSKEAFVSIESLMLLEINEKLRELTESRNPKDYYLIVEDSKGIPIFGKVKAFDKRRGVYTTRNMNKKELITKGRSVGKMEAIATEIFRIAAKYKVKRMLDRADGNRYRYIKAMIIQARQATGEKLFKGEGKQGIGKVESEHVFRKLTGWTGLLPIKTYRQESLDAAMICLANYHELKYILNDTFKKKKSLMKK